MLYKKNELTIIFSPQKRILIFTDLDFYYSCAWESYVFLLYLCTRKSEKLI
jgi:hypothetical protein